MNFREDENTDGVWINDEYLSAQEYRKLIRERQAEADEEFSRIIFFIVIIIGVITCLALF